MGFCTHTHSYAHLIHVHMKEDLNKIYTEYINAYLHALCTLRRQRESVVWAMVKQLADPDEELLCCPPRALGRAS